MPYKRNKRYRYRSRISNPLGGCVILGILIYSWFSELSTTDKYLILGLLVLLIVLYIKVLKNKQSPSKDELNNYFFVTRNTKRSVDNYEERSLLTETESKFYSFLSKALEGYDVTVNVKTRLEDLAKVKANTRSEYMRARGYVKSRHIDFILCDKMMNVICGIELDDSSHLDPKSREIDKFKDDLFSKINKELFRVNDLNKLEESAQYIVDTLCKENKINKTATNEIIHKEKLSEEQNSANETTISATEQFSECLIKELNGKNITIHKNIKLWDIAKTKEETKKYYLNSSEDVRNSVVDFVLCGEGMEILCGIDVNYIAETFEDERERNELKNIVFTSVGKQLYRVIHLDKLEESAKFIVDDIIKKYKL